MSWKQIRLELASTSGHSRESVSRGYLICAPLDAEGAHDEAVLDAAPHRATVRCFWSTEPDANGKLVAADEGLAFHCGAEILRMPLPGRRVRLDARIEVIEPDGRALPFRVASIRQRAAELLPS